MRSFDQMDWFSGRLSTNSSNPWSTQAYEAATNTTWDFVAMVRKDWKLVIGKRERGSTGAWETQVMTDIGYSNIGNINEDDSHNCVAICVDGLGYVHIMGNVHDNEDDPILRFNYARGTVPYGITSWENMDRHDIVGWDENSVTPATSANTYNFFRQFSDGGVAWFGSMHDGDDVIGRDIGLWYAGPASNEFTPAQGGTTTDIMFCTNNATDGADRSYALGAHVDEDDVLHFVGVFRETEGDSTSQLHPFYIKSADRGATWTNVDDAAVILPITRDRVDGAAGSAACEILIDGTTSQSANTLGGIIMNGGYPYISLGSAATGYYIAYHDGDEWRQWLHPNATGFQINGDIALANIDDEIWIFGFDAVTSLQQQGAAPRYRGYFMGRPWSPSVGSDDDWTINLGQMIWRTHSDASPSFNDGVSLTNCDTWMGGRSQGGSPIARFFMPDGDIPEFRQVGGHARVEE